MRLIKMSEDNDFTEHNTHNTISEETIFCALSLFLFSRMISSFPLDFKGGIVYIPVAEVGKRCFFSELCGIKDGGKDEETQETTMKETSRSQSTSKLFILFSGA
jgi:hypothetical protein